MPSIVGAVKFNSAGSGVVNFGDSFYVSPKHTSKSYHGAASNITGDFSIQNSGLSSTNTFDADPVDQNVVSNA
ncbi:spore germination protein [Bacillaceae bacterium SIJ1]|uniref:spore germination protein n=1 Tax=Litoribacterium kuwaitense TaxID=1398745 RepID=UPI0013EBFB7E|nr:spore germination protein [Litoribacterium kuwaitense]NGP44515.1 spore germination protein [Litoribacterium kuwaitense]